MFKKIHGTLDELKLYLISNIESIGTICHKTHTEVKNTNSRLTDLPKITKMASTIESQQRTIEFLINILADKYEHGFFIYSEDGKMPTIIRNGQKLTNKLVRHFDVSWDHGEVPVLNIEQLAGTYYDMEEN